MIQKLLRKDWDISAAFINDYNVKFMSFFWYLMFKVLNVVILIFTVYYSQTNGQSEWVNQIIEIIMQYYTARDEKNWIKVLFYISSVLNNSLNAVTKHTLNKINFDIKIKDLLTLINNFINEEWKRLHSYQWKKAEESIIYVNLIAKKHHNIKHKSIRFKVNNKVYLNLH